MNLPNRLTLLRLVLTALFVLVTSLEAPWVFDVKWLLAFSLFVVACFTDWLDGWVARRWNLITDFGKLMDPLADKVLVSAALFFLVEVERIPSWMAVLMVAREFLITGLRTLAASKGIVLAAERLGKHKTATQMAAIVAALAYGALYDLEWLTAGPASEPALDELGGRSFMTSAFAVWLDHLVNLLFWIATAITVWSGVAYLTKNREILSEHGSPSTAAG